MNIYRKIKTKIKVDKKVYFATMFIFAPVAVYILFGVSRCVYNFYTISSPSDVNKLNSVQQLHTTLNCQSDEKIKKAAFIKLLGFFKNQKYIPENIKEDLETYMSANPEFRNTYNSFYDISGTPEFIDSVAIFQKAGKNILTITLKESAPWELLSFTPIYSKGKLGNTTRLENGKAKSIFAPTKGIAKDGNIEITIGSLWYKKLLARIKIGKGGKRSVYSLLIDLNTQKVQWEKN